MKRQDREVYDIQKTDRKGVYLNCT